MVGLWWAKGAKIEVLGWWNVVNSGMMAGPSTPGLGYGSW